MDSLLICGGAYTYTTCITFSSGKWITSDNLYHRRDYHCSWQTEEGVVLMGGVVTGSQNTTEIVRVGVTQGRPTFPLKHYAE